MRNLFLTLIALLAVAFPASAAEPAPNGISLPEGFQDWRLISIDQRTDNQTLRVILGNDIAIKAARSGQVKPWPDGAILAKLVWKNAVHPLWPAATVPGEFTNADFMIRDQATYSGTGGWGFARWLGASQTPYGKDAAFAQECFGCHSVAKNSDHVFTQPVRLP